jgi:nucleotide-binding universal stress UspA family protein
MLLNWTKAVTGSHSQSKRISHIAETLSKQAYRLQYRDGEQQNITVTWSIVVDDDVTEGLIRTAEEGESTHRGGDDLIAMVPHERHEFKHLLAGSKTRSVIKATHLPVFIVPPKQEYLS